MKTLDKLIDNSFSPKEKEEIRLRSKEKGAAIRSFFPEGNKKLLKSRIQGVRHPPPNTEGQAKLR